MAPSLQGMVLSFTLCPSAAVVGPGWTPLFCCAEMFPWQRGPWEGLGSNLSCGLELERGVLQPQGEDRKHPGSICSLRCLLAFLRLQGEGCSMPFPMLPGASFTLSQA